MNWTALIPILIGGGSATTIGGASSGDPLAVGGGLFGALLGIGVAYLQARLAKKKK